MDNAERQLKLFEDMLNLVEELGPAQDMLVWVAAMALARLEKLAGQMERIEGTEQKKG